MTNSLRTRRDALSKMRTLCIIGTLLRLTSQLAPQSLWRTSQQIASLDAHTQHYGPVLVACTARHFLRGCSGIEAFSTTEHGCDCVLESLNVSLVNCGDGTALLRAALDGPSTLALRTSQSKRPPRPRFVDGEAVFAGRGDDVCELAIALNGDAFDGATGKIGACTLVRRGADAVLTGDDVAHVVAPLPLYNTLPTAGAAWAASVVEELVRQARPGVPGGLRITETRRWRREEAVRPRYKNAVNNTGRGPLRHRAGRAVGAAGPGVRAGPPRAPQHESNTRRARRGLLRAGPRAREKWKLRLRRDDVGHGRRQLAAGRLRGRPRRRFDYLRDGRPAR